MKQSLIRFTVLVGAILLSSVVQAEDEFQFWIDPADVALNLKKQVKATVQAQFRFGDGAELVRQHSDLGLMHTGLTDWLHASLNYRMIFRRREQDDFLRQDRVHLNFTFKGHWRNLGLSNRVRLEYNDLERVGDYQTIRNKFTINPPLEFKPNDQRLILAKQTLEPFGSYEIFYNTFDHTITRHRFQTGIAMALTDNIKGDISYIREESHSSIDPSNLNVLFMKIRFHF